MLLLSLVLQASAQESWKLTDLYASPEAWEAEVVKLETELRGLEACKGQLAKKLKPCVDLRFSLQQSVYRAETWASLGSDTDSRDDVWRGRAARASLLSSSYAEAASFFEPELVAMGEKKVATALKKDASLSPYSYYLRNTVRDAKHTLDPAREALLAAAGPIFQAPGSVYRVLSNAEIPWPTVSLHGKEQRLDPAAYTLFRGDADRATRQEVFTRFFGTLSGFEDSLGTTLDATVQGHWLVARTRGYPSSVAAALASDHLPENLYSTLVSETRAQLPILHRYLKLRAKMLGITDPAYHDLYAPLVSGERTWTMEEAKALTIASAAPLGSAYTEGLKEGFAGGWMDPYPKQGKVSGAYMNGSAYGIHPFVLMNYNGDYESVTTLAHEWGHAIHSLLSMRAQPYPTADYSTFIAEIASTGAEALLVDHMLKNAKDDDERLFYLGSALESLRTTYFRQAQFAEFELAIHQKVEGGEALTGGELSAMYLDVLNRTYGVEQGVTRVDPALAIEWAYIPHFYYNFYVYQYATSIAASSLLAEDVLANKPGAQERYLGLLRSGGSDDPYVLLKTAGVDMASPAPYQAIGRRMERLMGEVEEILKRQGK